MELNNAGKEVIFLKAITELIDDMVNHEIFTLFHNDPESELRFKSMTHQKYFNIILLDFLSCSDKKVLGEQSSYLGSLQNICNSPNFNQNNSINSLMKSTKEFIGWLKKEVLVKKSGCPQ
jgi:hypothetical protein